MHDDIIVLQALHEMKQAILNKTNETALKNKQIALACRIAFSQQSANRKSSRYIDDVISLANSIRIIAEFLIEKDFKAENTLQNRTYYNNCKVTSQDVMDFLQINKLIIES